MARLPRLTIPGYPHHLIQRGNDRQPIFGGTRDYEELLHLFADSARDNGVAIHAYVLMTNHFHLLATPQAQESIPRMMQSIGRRYVGYFNQRHGRTGTLWEGRYKSTVVQAESYLLACMAYIDLNPVRAGMVSHPGDYPWSGYLHHIGQRQGRLIVPHPLYWELGNTPFSREAAYRELVEAGITSQQQNALTDSAMHGWALGDSDYVAGLQKLTPRRIRKGSAGRPRVESAVPIDMSLIKS